MQIYLLKFKLKDFYFYRWLSVIIWCGLSCTCRANHTEFSRFFDYHRATMQEKLYLTLDRPYYETGDTIWFRGTLLSAHNHSYIVRTNYIYVELLNHSDQVVMRRKVLRDNLCFHHNLPLADSLASGEYTLRAYTSWMRNFSSDFFFSRKLTVYNRSVQPHPLPAVGRDFALTFFPEGGALLPGVAQRIAYKAEGNDGLPVEIDGVLKTTKGQVVAEIHSLHDGMGLVDLPAGAVAGDTLWAEVIIRDHTDSYGMPFGRTFALAVSDVSGYALQLEAWGNDSIRYRILSSSSVSDTIPGSEDSLVLLLHSGMSLIESRKIAMTDDTEGFFSISRCRSGVNHLILCDSGGTGLSRRLFFRNNNARTGTDARLKLDGVLKEPRELQTVRVSLQDASGQPLRGDFSVCVLDAGYVRCRYDSLRDNIVSHLFLTSDLRGYIHHPGWYFSPAVSEDVRTRALDLVMLTHGWCRFSTDTLRIPQQQLFPEPLEEREWLSGQIQALTRKDRNQAGKVPISVVDTLSNTFGTSLLDSAGCFFIGDLNYPDKANLQIRVLTTGRKPRFVFDKVCFPEGGHREPFYMNFGEQPSDSASNLLLLQGGTGTRLLKNVEVVRHRKEKERKDMTTGVSFRRDAAYLRDNYDYYQNDRGIDLINELIENEWSMWLDPLDPTEIDIVNDDPFALGEGRERKREEQQKRMGRQPAAFVINGTKYSLTSGIGLLTRLYSEDIASVRFVSPVENFGGKYIRISLNPGAEISDRVRDQRRTTHQVFGYTMPEYFYNPVYFTPEQKNWPEPDLRKTLRWEPSLQSDQTGQLDFQFYDSDHVGPRYVVIEGVTFDGRPVRVEKMFQ